MLKNINNRWFYLMVGLLLISFASLNGNMYPTYDMNLVTKEVAIIIDLIGSVIVVLACVCIIMKDSPKSTEINEEDIKREKAQFKNNQKKWQEHYSALKKKRGL